MSYTPSYTRKNFVNGQAPSINATNLNAIENTLVSLETFAVSADSAIAENASDISAEETARIAAINAEKTARESADSTLQTSINSKASQTEMDSVKTTLNNHTTLINNKYDKVYTSNDGAENLTDSDNGLLKNMMVKGKCEQTTFNGYNLINTFAYTRRDGITQISSDGVITVNNNLSGQIAGISFNCSSLPSGQYIFKNYSNVGYYVMLNSSDYSHYISPNQSYAITKADYLHVQGANIAVDATVTFKCMLESGTVAHAYEQFCGGIPSPNPSFPQTIKKVTNAKVVVRGKNLLDLSKGRLSNTIRLEDGKIIYTNDNYKGFWIKPDVKVGDTCTISFDVSLASGRAFVGGGGLAQRHYSSGGHYFHTFTYDGSEIAFCGDSATSSGYFSNVMVEYGSSATDYVPYQTEQSVSTNLTLYGIGSTCDYIDVERGKVVRKIGSVDLGSLSWTKTNENYYRFSTSISNTKNLDSSSIVANALCNKYCIVSASSQYASGVSGISKQGGNSDIWYARDTSYTSASDFKSAMNGTTLLYELATPTETDLDATVWANLKALTSYYPSTNLVITSDEINGSSTFDYPLNLESFIKSIQNGLQTLNEALGE